MKKSIKTIIATTVMTFAFAFTALASVYSTRWETQSDGNWKYKLDAGGYATTAWVQDEVDHNWYLLGDNGIMRSGIFESYGKYYLLSEVHDGHFGHLVKNGEVYHGITIQADTSADYEGALSQESINALKSLGYKFDSVTSVTGTQHVSNGQVTLSSSNNSNTTNNSNSQSRSSNGTKNHNVMTTEDYIADFGEELGSLFSSSSDNTYKNTGGIDTSNEGNIAGMNGNN